MRVQNLCYQHQAQAPYFFKDLSFEMEKGRIHALHGKNGVGKSILLHILGRQIESGALLTGEISLEPVVLMSQRFDQTLAGQFTFLENLTFSMLSKFPRPFTRLKDSPVPDHFLHLLERFQIDVTIPVHTLSGGQRQILALLMKLQKQPRILLLDEPTATLDEQNAVIVFEFLKALHGVTMLIVCHDRELMHRYTTGRHFHMKIGLNGTRHLEKLTEKFP